MCVSVIVLKQLYLQYTRIIVKFNIIYTSIFNNIINEKWTGKNEQKY